MPENTLCQSQGYINFSTYLGGSGSENVISTKVVNGETYILGTTTSSNFPVTNGSHYSGGNDGTITKLDTSGKIIYSEYIGGNGDDSLLYMEIVNREVFLAGNTTSSNYPVTNGSIYGGGGDVVITKLNATGGIAFSSYIGGSGNESLATSNFPTGYDLFLQVINNSIYIAGNTSSSNFPIVNGTGYKDSTDGFIVKLDTSGNTIFSTCLGGTSLDQITSMQIDNDNVYVSGSTSSTNFPVTNSTNILPNNNVDFVTKLNSNGAILFSTYAGKDGNNIASQMQVQNGNTYLVGVTTSSDFPVTNVSSMSSGEFLGGFITCLDTNGNIIYASYENGVASTFISFPYAVEVINGEVYMTIEYTTTAVHSTTYNVIVKLNAAGNVIYTSNSFTIDDFQVMKILNGEVYLTGTTSATNYPVTNGSTSNGSSGVFTILNTNGSLAYSTYLGQMSSLNDMQVTADKVYIDGTTNQATYTSTNGSTVSGGNDDIIIVLNSDGTPFFGGYLGGTYAESSIGLQIDSEAVYVSGLTNSLDYPVTDSSRYKANNDVYVTKLQFCPFNYNVSNDTLSPSTQTTCKLGAGSIITGKHIIIDSNEVPILYRNGLAQQQPNSEATYQWQIANSASGPWSDITSATSKDYLPTGGSITEYYRRLGITLPDCGIPTIDTSSIAIVFVNANIAPVVNAGGPLYICPGNTITIGGSPSATGGTPPYVKYDWGTNTDSIANPMVSPIISTIYTLTVTDSLGCKQLNQALVNVYKAADAGADKNNCAGTAVLIGTSPIVNVPGATYAWKPSTGLSDTTIAQPYANPIDSTSYTLTITLPQSGGGFCSTTDSVNVVPIAAPTANFAG
ncbi:MAG TPA: hypothetical protein VNZ45_11585, partial [Bacteroidia bacterium]|nr:hypothetical protein [Bacteroidia bacterium]